MNIKLVYLEDNEDLRALMSLELKRHLGIDCLSLAKLADFEAHSAEVLDSQMAFLDINLGQRQPTGYDAYRWLKRHIYGGKIFFLTGHASGSPLLAEAVGLDAIVLEKPIKTESLFSLIREHGKQKWGG